MEETEKSDTKRERKFIRIKKNDFRFVLHRLLFLIPFITLQNTIE